MFTNSAVSKQINTVPVGYVVGDHLRCLDFQKTPNDRPNAPSEPIHISSEVRGIH